MGYSPLFQHWSVLGIFKSKKEILNCVSVLRENHYQASDISILVSNRERSKDTPFLNLKKTTKNPETAITGSGVGAVLGTALGAFLGSGLVPGTEGVRELGPLLNSIFGFGAGAFIGAVTGAIIGRFVPEDDANDYEKNIKGNDILLSVHVDDEDEANETKKIFEKQGAQKIILNEKRSKISENQFNHPSQGEKYATAQSKQNQRQQRR